MLFSSVQSDSGRCKKGRIGFKLFLAAWLFSSAPLGAEPAKEPTNKLHILYLLQSNEFVKAFDLYEERRKALGRHDFEVLQEIALVILEQGATSPDPELQLTSLFGSSLAGISSSIAILESGILSPYPQTQMAAIHFLGQIQDDRCEALFTKAMSSEFFFSRLEAAEQLALRKSPSAVGQIESLMHKVPEQMHSFFPHFFALIGTVDATRLLRHMMDAPCHTTRVEAILNAALFGRDDLLPIIRTLATHLNVAEQEACAFALGALKDSKSLKALKKLSDSPTPSVRLAACRSLHLLGEETAKEGVEALAREGNLFALALLGEIPGSEETLFALLKSSDLQVRFNALFSLLKLRDSRVVPPLFEFLVRDSQDFGFQPHFSLGNSLMAWKVIPSARQHHKADGYDLLGVSLKVREHLLTSCQSLSPEAFLKVAEHLFESQQIDLIPCLTSLLENVQTEKAIDLLCQKAQTAGAPLTRAYCNLALLRIKKEEVYKKAVLRWIALKEEVEMIRFRPMLPWNVRLGDKGDSFELTPEENSRLLIECYKTLALEHTEKSLQVLIDGLKNGPVKNRPVLAGLLIQALQ